MNHRPARLVCRLFQTGSQPSALPGLGFRCRLLLQRWLMTQAYNRRETFCRGKIPSFDPIPPEKKTEALGMADRNRAPAQEPFDKVESKKAA